MDRRDAASRTIRFGPWLLLAGLLPLWGPATAGGADPPTLITITPNAQFEDWASVLTNPRNVTVDGDGLSVPCGETLDRDCRVASPSGDLRRFAWTYDATNLYIYAERYGGSTGSDAFWLHLDLDGDGLVGGPPDRLVRYRYQGNGGDVDWGVYEYLPFDPLGDPLADVQGYADGYRMPGMPGPLLASQAGGPTGLTDGSRFEAAVPWVDLGRAGPTPFGFHLGVNNASSSPDNTDDNLGGPDRRPGSTAFRLHRIAPDHEGAAGPQETIRHDHLITNDGNLPDSYRLHTVSSEGYEIRLLSDPDGDTFPDALMAIDSRGNGVYTDSQDELYADGDGDTFPETPTLAPGESFGLIVEVVAGRSAKGYFDTTRVIATSLAEDTGEEAWISTAVGWITVIPEIQISTEPDTPVLFAHEVENHLDTRTCVNFQWVSAQGWSYELWTDPDADGDPSDGVQLFDSCGDGDPDLQPIAGEMIPFVATSHVPPGTPLGTQETLVLQAQSVLTGSQRASVTDELAVADVLGLSPSYTIAGGTAKSAPTPGRIWFRHRLEHAGLATDTFTLTVTQPPGQNAVLHTDPNGDGAPDDGLDLGASASSGALQALGGSFPFLVRLDVAEGTPPDTVLTMTVTATSDGNPGLTRQVIDEAVVSQIVAFADPLFALQESRYPQCATIWALCSSLVPSQSGRYRIVWVDEGGGATLQTSAVTSDAAGEAYDSLVVDAASPIGLYSVRLQEWTGFQWIDLSRDEFTVESLGTLRSLLTDQSTYLMDAEELLVAATFENDGPIPLEDVVVHFLVVDPTGTQYMRTDGTFAQIAPDEWTWTSGPFNLGPGAVRAEAMTVGPPSFPGPGIYTVRAVGEGVCGNEIGTSEVTFEVIADSDGDGWWDPEETDTYGTDPFDADTDDDGLLDPVDGPGDADGDTVIDALQCDSDSDGLPDGLEIGLDGLSLHADTDTGAGCFVADGDAGATTTNRLVADTDGGGELDGAEDLSGDGVFDDGEKDPLDLTDDPCWWGPPGEIGGLELMRAGASVVLYWPKPPASDPCLSYRLLAASDTVPLAAGEFSDLVSGLTIPQHVHGGAAQDGSLHFYLVLGSGRIGGDGLLGHYGQ